jgi:hypothetical protein
LEAIFNSNETVIKYKNDKFTYTRPSSFIRKFRLKRFRKIGPSSQILSAAERSFNGRRALKRWLMSIQKGDFHGSESKMSPEQSSALCEMMADGEEER